MSDSPIKQNKYIPKKCVTFIIIQFILRFLSGFSCTFPKEIKRKTYRGIDDK